MAAYLLSMGSQWDHGSHLQALFRFPQSIPAPPEKAVLKAPEHLIQVASGRFRVRLEGCVSAGLKSLLVRQSKNRLRLSL